MKYLHNKNILHLDLKAANILVDEFLFPKISDFGLSMKINEIKTNDFKGTPSHAAPEIWKNLGYTKQVDVYAFGLTVYEIMTNEKPFADFKGIYQLMIEVTIKGSRPTFKYEIPNCYKKLIEDCWSQDPSDRPSFDEIVEKIRNCKDFVNEAMVDENEFLDFVELIDKNTINFVLKTNEKLNVESNNTIIAKSESIVECTNSLNEKIIENDE